MSRFIPSFIERLWHRDPPPEPPPADGVTVAEMRAIAANLGVQPTAIEFARALAAVQVVRARGTGRVSQDRPEMANFGMSVLQPPEADLDWRIERLDSSTFDRIQPTRLLELLCDASPDVSRALWDFLRFSNPGYEIRALRLGTQDVDERAQANLDAFVGTLTSLYGTFDVVLNRLFFSAFLRGAFVAELVLDKSGQPCDLATPDPKIVKFRAIQDPGGVRGLIWQPGQYQGGEWINLDIPTFRYVPVDPFPGSPYGRALCSPALFTTLFALALLHDLKRVVQQQGYPRLDISIDMEKIRAWLIPMAGADAKKLKEAFDEYVRQVRDGYRNLEPDDAFVHADSIIMNKPQGTVDSSSLGAIDGLVAYLERLAQRALKSNSVFFSLDQGLSEASANRLVEVWAAGIRALQHACETLLEHMFGLALQAMGTPAEVSFKLAELRKSEQLRDEQVRALEVRNWLLLYYAGVCSQEQMAEGLGFDAPDQPEPRLPGVGVQAAAGAGLTGENNPAGARPDSGADRMIPDFLPPLNGNGHAKGVAA